MRLFSSNFDFLTPDFFWFPLIWSCVSGSYFWLLYTLSLVGFDILCPIPAIGLEMRCGQSIGLVSSWVLIRCWSKILWLLIRSCKAIPIMKRRARMWNFSNLLMSKFLIDRGDKGRSLHFTRLVLLIDVCCAGLSYWYGAFLVSGLLCWFECQFRCLRIWQSKYLNVSKFASRVPSMMISMVGVRCALIEYFRLTETDCQDKQFWSYRESIKHQLQFEFPVKERDDLYKPLRSSDVLKNS